MNISWTALYFPRAGVYNIYHTYKVNRSIIDIYGYSGGAIFNRSKYDYFSRPYNSTNITFEIRDITSDDAGYYYGGQSPESVLYGRGVVLIVHGEYIFIGGSRGRRKGVTVVAATPLKLKNN